MGKQARAWMVVVGLVMLLGAGATAHNADAQDATATPAVTAEWVIGWRVQTLFPAALRFTVDVQLPASALDFAVLEIRLEDAPAVTIPVSTVTTAEVLGPDWTRISALWTFSTTTPRIFSDIGYTWTVNQRGGGSGGVTARHTFTDPRATWQRYEGPPRMIVDRESNSGGTAATLSQMYDLLQVQSGLSNFRTPRLWLIYSAARAVGCEIVEGRTVAINLEDAEDVVPCDPTVAGTIYRGYDVVSLADLPTDTSLLDLLSEQMLSDYYANAWAGRDMPAWFRVGLAQFLLPSRVGHLDVARGASRTNALFSYADLATISDSNAPLWRAQAFGLVTYTAQQIGVDGLFALARATGPFDAAYRAAMGQSPAQVETEWRSWLFSAAAESNYNYTPYMDTTATPTPTNTPTNTPTATPTDTATTTFTPIPPTATPIPPNTFPTFTPTPSEIAANASNTPRPAGSLRLITPTATPPPAGTAGNNRVNVGWVLGGVGVGAALLAGAFLLVRRRVGR
jgi:hypothetical protein